MRHNIVKFPTPTRKPCHGCGILFRPVSGEHRFCRTCHHWHRIGQHIEQTAGLLQEVRS